MADPHAWLDLVKRRGERVQYELVGTVLEQRTAYQKLLIVDTVAYGRALFLDDKIQSSELDEFIYHESLVHPALVCHPSPRRVFIAGGGECATLREVLRHRSVEEVVMVDIDAVVTAAAREHLPQWSAGTLEDPRVRLIHADARGFLEGSPAPFDAIVVDVTDPLAGGPSYRLFTLEFYRLAHERLAPNGVIAVQAESADVGFNAGFHSIRRTVGEVFDIARGYQAHVPSFGESWGFVVGCKGVGGAPALDPSVLDPESVDAILSERGCSDLRFYDGVTHRRLFSPPRYDRVLTSAELPIISDDNPLVLEA